MVLGVVRSEAAPRQLADRLGMWTSGLCVVHCLLTPVLLSSASVFAHFLPAEENTHRALALLVALFGAIALLFGFRRHRRKRVLLLMGCGLACIAGAAWFGSRLPSHMYEVAVTVCGSAMMITAHRLNHTFCRSCECSALPEG
jgi:peptidoglycan/LPS O-acetylase OafA/YrhL